MGLLLHAIVHPAHIQDRDGGILLLSALFGLFPFRKKLFAYGGYQGPQFQEALAKKALLFNSTSKSSSAPIEPRVSKSYPNAGSSRGPSPGLTAAAGSPRILKILPGQR